MSGSGRFVSFQTFGRFGREDRDAREDVYVRDLRRGRTSQVSLLPGAGGDVPSSVLNGDISDDGNLVTFGNSNSLWVRHVRERRTTRFWNEPNSPPCQPFPAGSAGRPAISGNGRFVAFASCATKLPGEDGSFTDVYRLHLASGSIEAVTRGTGHSYLPSLSRRGRYVGFGSDADDLVAGDRGGQPDGFVADLVSGTTTRASQARDGTGGNSFSAANAVAISGDGQSLAYVSYASNLVPGDRYDFPEAFLWRR
jgi:Tol biopolymer transport system component